MITGSCEPPKEQRRGKDELSVLHVRQRPQECRGKAHGRDPGEPASQVIEGATRHREIEPGVTCGDEQLGTLVNITATVVSGSSIEHGTEEMVAWSKTTSMPSMTWATAAASTRPPPTTWMLLCTGSRCSRLPLDQVRVNESRATRNEKHFASLPLRTIRTGFICPPSTITSSVCVGKPDAMLFNLCRTDHRADRS